MTLGRLTAALPLLLAAASLSAQQPTVQVAPGKPDGPRPLAEQTRAAVLRDYLQAWQAMDNAFRANQPAPLDAAFTGEARERLGEVITEQAALGVRSRYRDLAHDIRVLFYSPEGLSIELADDVSYEIELIGADNKPVATVHQTARYIAVLTPTEVRWKVRVLQGGGAHIGKQ